MSRRCNNVPIIAPQGPPGPPGQNGSQGHPGIPGTPGSQIIAAPGVPSDELGNDGDLYIDTITNNYYSKVNGVWELRGSFGGGGGSGAQILTGNGVPPVGLGVNGDLYIDNLTGNYYSKIGGVWVLQGNLRGPPGTPGSQILTGNGIPSSSIGSNGDLYIDNSTGDYYQKIGGIWVLQGSLQGPPGEPGSQIFTGVGVPPPALGVDGDIFIDNTTGNYYQKQGGIWLLQGNLQGPQGPQGIPGEDGSQIFTASGAPPPALGVDGDLYIDTLNGNYYQKIGGVWTLRGNLQGPPGPPGSQIITGSGPPSPSLGVDGDLYIDTTTGEYYQKQGGVWVPQGTIGGGGATIFTGSGVPPQALGVDGDLYIDNSSGNYYQKQGGVWLLQGNLQGPPGEPGSQIFTGSGVPDPSLGVDGDLYINNDNGDYYQKQGGVWVPQGTFGGGGSQIFTGAGVPSSSLGQDGDFYLDTTTSNYYTKSGGIWNLEGNLQGPPGPPGNPGSQILTGNGAPSSALGVNGDFYLDNVTGDYYIKAGGVWALEGNLRGPPGTPGAPGSQIYTDAGIPSSALGVDGDFYLDTSTGDYYTKVGGVWTLQGNLQGPPGAPGAPGSQIFTDAGAPSSALGQDGDFYLNTLNGDYYTKSGGIWNLEGNLQGAPGSQIYSSIGVPSPALGVDGDFYLDSVTGNYYIKSGGVWALEGNLQGPEGQPGDPGSAILTGSGAPLITLGNNGDFYVDTTTGVYYTKDAGVWTVKGNFTGPPGPSAGISLAVFGDGSDGPGVINTNTTLTRDMFYTTLTVASGVTLNTAGFRIFVRGQLTNNGTIGHPGGNANGTVPGFGPLGGTLGKGFQGGSSATSGAATLNVPSIQTPGQYGGGSGGAGAPGGAVSATSPNLGGDGLLRNLLDISKVRTLNSTQYNGGSGGGGGATASGGAGGGGGGVVMILAYTIANSGVFTAAGGNGGTVTTAGAGGGGGGGGGLVVIVTTSTAAAFPPSLVNVSGGAGGSGPLASGANGGVGGVYILRV